MNEAKTPEFGGIKTEATPCNQSELIKALGGMVNGDDADKPWIDPEECEFCGCPAGEFDDTDWKCGGWHCPECGQPQ